jgi:choline dehydrogenase-like flavoprotein
MFTTGNISHGCGHAVRTVSAGLRTTAADYVTKSHSRKNLTILTSSIVEKIRLEKQSNAFNASGVQVITNGQPMEYYEARREIIISAGAYCSPPILLRSGIGAKVDVEKHGIKSLIDLPGVGKNLQDHLIVFTFYELSEPKLTTDHLIYHGDAHPQALDLWKFSKTGFLSSFPFGSFAFARLDDRLMDSPLWRNSLREPGCDPMGLTPQQPNIEFFNTECYGGPPHLFNEYPLDGQSTFSVLTELFAPRSRGTVQLKSADPAVNPVVENNYLSDPLDLLVLAEGCRLGNEIVTEGSGTKGVVKGAWPEDLMHHEYTTREQWIEFVKDQAVTCESKLGRWCI